MTQIGEMVDVPTFLDKHDDDCYFCNKKEAQEAARADDSEEDFSEDTLIGLATGGTGITHKNDSGKLGRACSPGPGEKWVTDETWYADPNGDQVWELCVEHAAHHLIPGDAALKPSKLFKAEEFGLKTQGEAVGNIGYNVNNQINGVWLPGNYAFANQAMARLKQNWGPKGGTFYKAFGVEPKDYAAHAIEKTNSQFHDSHEAYSDYVLQALNKIHNKLKKSKDTPWCEKASQDDNKDPLFPLVGRMSTISLKLRKMLVYPVSNWKKNVFTSEFSRQWMSEYNN